MEQALSVPPTPIRWLTAANVLWLLAGVVAYATSISLVVGTAIALVPALRGIMEAKRAATEPVAREWLDRGMSAAVAGWALLAVMIIIPYIATEDGLSLWANRGFTGLGIITASIAMLLWNAAVFRAFAPAGEQRSLRLYAGFHAALLVLAVAFFVRSDRATTVLTLRGQDITMPDPMMSAGLAAAPALLWALLTWRLRLSS